MMVDVVEFFRKIYNKIYIPIYKKKFAKCGLNVSFSPLDSKFTYGNMYLGDNVNIGYGADMIATRSRILIGDHVVFGPKVSIRGGDHRIDFIGKFIDQVDDTMKKPENDQDVIFEGDNWIGMNVTILKGVKIGRGSVIAAGAVVNRSIPPYSIVGGVPAKILRYRFTSDEISKHESLLK